MDQFAQRYKQKAFERDFPEDGQAGAAPAPKPEAKGSRERAQENAPGVSDVGMALADMFAGAAKGAVAQVIGLPGDIESLYRLIADGQQRMLTTEDVQKLLPPVVPEGGDPKRRQTAKVAEEAGTFLPMAPVGIARSAASAVKRVKFNAAGKRVAEGAK